MHIHDLHDYLYDLNDLYLSLTSFFDDDDHVNSKLTLEVSVFCLSWELLAGCCARDV